MQFLRIFEELQKHKFSKPILKYNSDFKVLVSTVLSARTRDETTKKAADSLFEKYPTAEKLAGADLKNIKKLIKKVGFYKVKAARIKQLSRILLDNWHGKVPSTLADLLFLPGVGRKTAQCVRIYAFDLDGIAVDTHVHRISNRLGLVKTKKPEETEQKLMQKVPNKYWKYINNLFVKFGQNICLPINPKCEICRIKEYCKYPKTKNK
ncbi:MAG: endonuclease III [archaeon]